MKRQIKIALCGMAIVSASLCMAYNQYQSNGHESATNSILLANVEALTDGNDINKDGYEILPYDCGITIDAKAKAILQLSGIGDATITGARDCKYKGTCMCSPISCLDIYKVLFGH